MAEEKPDDLYANIADEIRETKTQRLSGSMTLAGKSNPDHEAKVIDLAERTGVPADTARRNIDKIKEEDRFGEVDFDQLQNDYPTFAEYLSNPDNAKVVDKHDVASLSGIEWLFKAPYPALLQGQTVVELGELGNKAMGPGLTDREEEYVDWLHKKAAEDLGAEGFLDKAYVGAFKFLPYLGGMFTSSTERGMQFALAAGGITALAGQAGPQVFAPEEVVTVPLATAGGYAVGTVYGGYEYTQQIEAGNAFLEYREITSTDGQKLDPRIASMAAEIAGGGSALLEMAGVTVLMKALPGGNKLISKFTRAGIKDLLLKPGVIPALTRLSARFAGVWTTEVAQEVGQEAIVILMGEAAKEYADEEFPAMTSEQIKERLKETAITSAQEFFFISGAGPSMRFAREIRSQQRIKTAAETNKNVLLALGETGGKSELLKRLPKKYQEWVQRARADGPIENVYIEAAKLEEYFQTIDPKELLQSVPAIAEQMSEAREIGGDIVIPIEDFATYIAPTEHLEALVDDMRLNADDVSVNVAKTLELPAVEDLDQVDPDQRVFDDVQQRQIEAGAAPDVAAKNAAVWGAWFKVMGEKAGRDAFDVYEQYGLRVQRKTPEEIQRVADLEAVIEEARTPLAEAIAAAKTELAAFDAKVDKEGMEVAREKVKELEAKEPPSDEQREAAATLRTYLEALDIDIETAASEDIRAALEQIEGEDELFQMGRDISPLGFYSAAAEAASNLKQAKGTPAQMLVMLKKSPGAKAEEIEWTGLAEWMGDRKSVTRDEIAEFLDQNGVTVEETILASDIPQRTSAEWQGLVDEAEGREDWDEARRLTVEQETAEGLGPPGTPKFAEYVLPGGKNYREVLLTLPVKILSEKEARDVLGAKPDARLSAADIGYASRKATTEYVGQHFDQPNVLAHLRVDDRTGPNGERILFIEEIQSDWHQAGRREGYDVDQKLTAEEEELRYLNGRTWEAFNRPMTPKELTRMDELKAKGVGKSLEAKLRRRGIPDAPFKKTWHQLALKRAMRMAVEGGYDTVAWTPGDVQADRYDLSKQISKVELSNTSGGIGKADPEFTSGMLTAYDLEGRQVIDQFIRDPAQIEEYVGKDAAQKLIEQEGRAGRRAGMGAHIREVSGLDLKVGGEGMKVFYDKMLPSAAKKLTKKLGGEVGMQRFGGGPVVHTIAITPELKASAEAGLPLFQDTITDPRGAIRFGAGETIITLMEKSNLSTFLHETGHFFLNAFGDLAIDPDAPQDIKDDYAIILDYLGVKSREQIGRDQHELFARTFEAYLFEGKAPSIALQSTFDRFAAWLLEIYKKVVNLDVPINDEIRGVFDRMLATSEEIEAAEAQQNYSMIFDSAEAGEMTEAEYTELQKAGQRAESAGKSELLKRALIETRRVRQKQWREEEAKVREEVTATVDSQRVNQLRLFLRTGEGDIPKNIAGKKLARKAVVDILGGEAKKLPVGSVRKTGGVNPDSLAVVFGYDSGHAMLRAMLDQPKRAPSIKGEVDRIMKERHGDLLNDGTIQREAVDAVHNDQRGRFIAGQLKYLSRSAGVAPTPISLAKEHARRLISGKRVVDATQVGFYAAAERRAAVAAQKALGKKDMIEAANQGRKQLINHYMFIEARKAADEVDKILRQAAKYRKKGTRKNIAQDYLDQIDALLERFDLRRGVSMKAVERRASLAEWMEAQEEAGNDIIIDEKLAREAYRKSYKIMTMEEIRGLRDAIKNIDHLGRRKETYLRNKVRRELDADAAIIDAQLSENIPPHKQPVNPQREGEVRKRGIFNFIGLMTKVQTTIERADGGQRDGPVYQILKRAIDEGQIRAVKRQQVAGEQFHAIMRKHFGKGKFMMENLSRKKVYIAAIDESLSREEMLGVALNQGNADSQIKFREGRGWTQAQVDAILDNLTENDWGFVGDIWTYLHEFWPEISALEKERTGVMPEKVEAQAVQTKFGELAGGYYPLMYDAILDLKARSLMQEQTIKEMKTGSFTKAQTKRGHTIARVEGVNRPVRIDLGVITQHLNQVIMDLELGPAIDAGQKILHHGPTRDTIVRHLAPDGFVALDIWMKDVAVNSLIGGDIVSGILRNLRSTVSVGAMGLKLSTAIIQVSGFAHTLVVLGPKYTGKGLQRFLWSGRDVVKDVYAKSTFMEMRGTTFHRDIMDTMNAVRGKDIQTHAMKTYFWMIAKMQQIVDIPTWLGAYEQAIDEGKSEDDAVRFADLTVEDAQGSGLMTALAPIERGTAGPNTRLSEMVKLFTAFYSYFNTKGNIAIRQFHSTDFKNPKEFARFMADFALLFWIEALVGDVMLGRMPDFDEEEEPGEAMFWYSVRSVFEQILSTLPFARQISSTIEGFSGAPGGTRAIEDVGGAIGHLYRTTEGAFEGEEVDPVRLTKDILTIINVAAPVKIPVGQIDVTLKAIQEFEEGEEVSPMDIIRKPRS